MRMRRIIPGWLVNKQHRHILNALSIRTALADSQGRFCVPAGLFAEGTQRAIVN
jgi:hypothetical protein